MKIARPTLIRSTGSTLGKGTRPPIPLLWIVGRMASPFTILLASPELPTLLSLLSTGCDTPIHGQNRPGDPGGLI